MPAQKQIPIVFTVAVDQEDWDNQFGGWRCSALRIPSAQVDAVFATGRRVEESWYVVDRKHEVICWTRPNPPEKARFSISLAEELSTQELTIRWRKLAILLPLISAILVTLIAGAFSYFPSRTSSNSRERIALNLSSPVYGDCGLVTINGSAEISTDSQGKVTRITWDWGDGVSVDSFFPASHRYSQNRQYSAKVTAYASNNEAEGRTIPINVTSINPECR